MQQSLIYAFVLNMWVMNKVDEAFISGQARLGRLTEDEVEMILATPQNS